MLRTWHHAPLHVLTESGVYMLTAGTYLKQHYFATIERLRLLHDQLHAVCAEYGWNLQAWAVLSNHYHFVASAAGNPATLRRVCSKVHTLTAKAINSSDSRP